MKLSKEHIGRMVRIVRDDMPEGTTPFKVLDIGEADVWVEDQNGRRHAVDRSWCFEIVEPNKKPSERIREIVQNSESQLTDTPLKVLNAIVQYLDEQVDKK